MTNNSAVLNLLPCHFECVSAFEKATDVPLMCHRGVDTSTSRPDSLAPILNCDEQTKTAHPTQQHMQSVGGEKWPPDSENCSY